MITFLAFFKTKMGIVMAIVAVLVVFSLFYFRDSSGPAYEYITASRGDVVQEVNVTGRVVPAESVNLAFEKSGRVVGVYKDVGDSVFAGETLVALDSSEIQAELQRAKADVEVQQATLAELLRGTRDEEIKVGEIKVSNAKVSLEDAKQNFVDKLRDSYTKSDDAIRNKVDQFFSNSRTSNPQINFPVSGQLKINMESGRVDAERLLNQWNSVFVSLTTAELLLQEAILAKQRLFTLTGFLSIVATSLNELSASGSITQATIDGYRSDISTARTNINSAISNISSAEEKLRTAQSAFSLAKEELVLLSAGTLEEAIRAQEAQVARARATVALSEAQLAKTALYAPIRGTVSVQGATVGEIVPANTVVVSLISKAEFEIETKIPEADIAKVLVGQEALVTLDAYGRDEEFYAKVVSMEPAETIVEGVATYKVTLQFSADDGRIRSGMTANIDIRSGFREGVVVVPARSIIRRGGDKLVRVLTDEGVVREVSVELGLIGSEGSVEILEGVTAGDRIIQFVPGDK